MNRKLFFVIIVVICVGFFFGEVFSVTNFFRVYGSFTPLATWTGGHPGKISFDLGSSNSGYSVGVDADGYLTGYFWLGNVGWATFSHGLENIERPRILCADNVFKDVTAICPLSGYAWSQNAGWIALSGSWIAGSGPTGVYATGVYYNPAKGLIEGFGHSRALGWVPFYAQAGSPISATIQTGIVLDGIGLNFIGKIAIIGNVAGTRIYNLPNQHIGEIFSSINHRDMLNQIRKNIALLTRNISPEELMDPDNNFLFFEHRGSDYDTGVGGWIWPTGKRTIIVRGHDLILRRTGGPSFQSIGSDTDANRAFIVLADRYGNGGNVYIDADLKQIYATIYAEGSIYSGYKSSTGMSVPYIGLGAWNIPQNQLYIKGSLISKNTIGGSLQSPPVCPVVVTNCTTAIAQIFDINYFRAYDSIDTTQRSIPSIYWGDSRFSKAAIVIEYNPELASNPPPGLERIIQ